MIHPSYVEFMNVGMPKYESLILLYLREILLMMFVDDTGGRNLLQ